jgi:hypothetical protein
VCSREVIVAVIFFLLFFIAIMGSIGRVVRKRVWRLLIAGHDSPDSHGS